MIHTHCHATRRKGATDERRHKEGKEGKEGEAKEMERRQPTLAARLVAHTLAGHPMLRILLHPMLPSLPRDAGAH
jgi:hypothetical protein